MKSGVNARGVVLLMAAWAILAAGSFFLADRVLRDGDRAALAAAHAEARAAAEGMRQKAYRLIDAIESVHRLAALRQYHVDEESQAAAQRTEDAIIEFASTNRFGVIQSAVIGPDGILAWSSVPGWQPVDLADREHFRVHAEGSYGGMFVSVPLLGRASGQWSVQFTRALRHANGTFAGVSVVSVNPAALQSEIESSLRDNADMASLLRLPDAIVLARVPPNPSLLGVPSLVARQIRETLERQSADRSFIARFPQTQSTYSGMLYYILPHALVLEYSVNVTAVGDQRAAIRWMVWLTLCLALLVILLAMVSLVFVGERNLERSRNNAVDQAICQLPIAVYRAVVSPSGIFRTIYSSPNLGRVIGTQASDKGAPTGIDWHAGIDPADRRRLRAFLNDLRSKRSAEVEYRTTADDGRLRIIRERASVLNHLPGGEMEVSGYLTDLTTQREIERKASDSVKLATLGEMAAGVAHEMNQPLTTALLAAENAQYDLDQNDHNAAKQRLKRIIDSVTRTTGITESLCRFVRGEEQEQPAAVDVATALQGALLLVGSALRAERVELKQTLPENLPPVVARPIELEQVFVNLLVNARDAFCTRPADGRRIDISARRGEHAVAITVQDNAGGIPDAALDRLFDPFFTTKEPGKGTGLGLAICRRMVEELGGTIVAANAHGGARFTIELPVSDAGRGEQVSARSGT